LIKRKLLNSGIRKKSIYILRKENFAKINTEALFNAVDFDKSGEITEDEWLAFWEIVKKSGHTEEEINEEVGYLKCYILY
jgi:hypothetical protein